MPPPALIVLAPQLLFATGSIVLVPHFPPFSVTFVAYVLGYITFTHRVVCFDSQRWSVTYGSPRHFIPTFWVGSCRVLIVADFLRESLSQIIDS